MTATVHFQQRVRERIGYNVDPYKLARELILGIENRDTDFVRFVGRASKCGRRVFWFKLPNRGAYYALIDTSSMTCLTVLPPGFTVNMAGKRTIELRDTDV
jgi:hypothetical protein